MGHTLTNSMNPLRPAFLHFKSSVSIAEQCVNVIFGHKNNEVSKQYQAHATFYVMSDT